MSSNGNEAEDICKNKGSLVVNMGTVDPYALTNYLKAIRAYNQARQPVVFDPVGYDYGYSPSYLSLFTC